VKLPFERIPRGVKILFASDTFLMLMEGIEGIE
jgi:hypothetical protein